MVHIFISSGKCSVSEGFHVFRNTEADAILTEHAKKLKEVLSYIDAHYMEELTISGLAGICFFSEYYFMRFFKKYMGMSCVQYIKNVRLERAADQFENG